jgi:hypothetical protein
VTQKGGTSVREYLVEVDPAARAYFEARRQFFVMAVHTPPERRPTVSWWTMLLGWLGVGSADAEGIFAGGG